MEWLVVLFVVCGVMVVEAFFPDPHEPRIWNGLNHDNDEADDNL